MRPHTQSDFNSTRIDFAYVMKDGGVRAIQAYQAKNDWRFLFKGGQLAAGYGIRFKVASA